ncbi:hypothetical protein CFOL_v3_12350 [Cephalotus follicularis]|uniref:Uncharacterized protein n=1 Tax=Cephalotus follicularis TaxID=3775 RepID=A0A1Q3BLE8_CEPFO|nr:hypothetical protein CFOL_v3_12350 [Cephalotus follicularis]
MAIGGSYKGNNSGNRGRPYGLMLLLAFGAALLGVMMLHKLRERRIFNLLLKDKDNDLVSLHLLLQKEREHTKEMRKKSDEMKEMIYSLRTQKMELDSRLLEKQSTIESLKDEQRAMESALKERQNEIDMLRENAGDFGKENPQVISLSESLKQKEADINDLKPHLEYPDKVWSASTDDPSNTLVNLTLTTEQKEKTEISKSEKEADQFHQATNYRDNENTTRDEGSHNLVTRFRERYDTARVEDRRQNREENTDKAKLTKEELQVIEKLKEQGIKDKDATGETDFNGQKENNKNFQNIYRVAEERSVGNDTEAVAYTGGEVFKSNVEDSDVKSVDSDPKIFTGKGKLETSQEGDSQDLGATSKGDTKLEVAENSTSAGSRMRGKQGRVSRPFGKRWKTIAKNNGNLENYGAANMRSRILSNNNGDGMKREAFTDEGKMERNREGPTDEKNPHEVRTASSYKFMKPQNRESLEATNITSTGKREPLDETRQLEEQEVTNILETINSRHINNIEKSDEQVKQARNYGVPEDQEVVDIQELEKDAAGEDFFRETTGTLEEDNDRREETDEPEF